MLPGQSSTSTSVRVCVCVLIYPSIYRYGKHVSNNSYYFCYDPPKIVSMFDRLRNMPDTGHYPASVGRFEIIGVRDLTVDYDSSYPDKKAVSFFFLVFCFLKKTKRLIIFYFQPPLF